VKQLRVPAISTGEMFRAETRAASSLGRRARAILARGGLIGDEIVNAMVAGRIAAEDCRNGFLLDGYPRTLNQARFFSRLLDERRLPSPVVVHLDAPADTLVARLSGRRQCPQCLRIYNLATQSSRVPGLCDDDGAALITREDDHEGVIRERIRAYREETGPVLEWFDAALVRRVNGDRPPAEVANHVAKVVAGPKVLRAG
jgi:adenylate kinase